MDHQQLTERILRETAKRTIERAKELIPQPTWSTATVTSYDADSLKATVAMDSDSAVGGDDTHALNITGRDLKVDTRVMVCFVPPHAAHVVGVLWNASWQEYSPSIYYETGTPGTYAEINYGTNPYRQAWYRDDGETVDFVQQIRLASDADLGPDSRSLCIGLPVRADTGLGNTFAVAINAQVTLGIRFLDHFTDLSLHCGRPNDLANGNFAYFVPPGVGAVMSNTYDGVTSDGNTLTGWHDFHVAGRYRRISVAALYDS